jgi:hypothetical protein
MIYTTCLAWKLSFCAAKTSKTSYYSGWFF